MWLEKIMERAVISPLCQCFLQVDYRGLGCFSEYSSRSASGLQPCVVELPSKFLMLTGYRAGASGIGPNTEAWLLRIQWSTEV